jgi:hypothetical protein
MKDFLRMHELELDAVRPRFGRRIDERAGFVHVALVGGSNLGDDEARASRPDIPMCEADHRF